MLYLDIFFTNETNGGGDGSYEIINATLYTGQQSCLTQALTKLEVQNRIKTLLKEPAMSRDDVEFNMKELQKILLITANTALMYKRVTQNKTKYKMRKIKARQYKSDLMRQLNELRTSNPSHYWKLLNDLRENLYRRKSGPNRMGIIF